MHNLAHKLVHFIAMGTGHHHNAMARHQLKPELGG